MDNDALFLHEGLKAKAGGTCTAWSTKEGGTIAVTETDVD